MKNRGTDTFSSSWSLALFLGGFVSVLGTGCEAGNARQAPRSDGPHFACREEVVRCLNISNDAVEWHVKESAITLVLCPVINGKDERETLLTKPEIEPGLLAMLGDPDRWVAAHTLLALRNPKLISEPITLKTVEELLNDEESRIARESLSRRPAAADHSMMYGVLRLDYDSKDRLLKFDDSQRATIRAYWVRRFQSDDFLLRRPIPESILKDVLGKPE